MENTIKIGEVPRRSGSIPSRRGIPTGLLVLAGAFAGALVAGLSVWLFFAHTEEKLAESVIEEVGQHVLLPADIKPRVAEMVNPDLFKDDPFWSQAAVGDKILVYPYKDEIVRAIIWRSSEAKIVDIGLVSITPDTSQPLR